MSQRLVPSVTFLNESTRNISAENESLVLIVKCEPAWTVNDFHLVDAPSISKRF